MKRWIDLLISVPMFIVLSPIMAIVCILTFLIMGAPVLFRQERPGLHGKPFTLYKFRTMLEDTDMKGELLSDGVRLTPFGRILRKFSLDEIPQLINVIRGDMSLVGPRPLLMEYLPLYTPEQARRHEVRPGITGWAQVNGRNTISWEDKFAYDVWYVDHLSLILDMRILLLTIKKVFLSEGVQAEGHDTVEKFRGAGK